MLQHVPTDDIAAAAAAAENETRARLEMEAREEAAAALWRPGADPLSGEAEAARADLAARWPAPDPEEEAMLVAAASHARRRLGAPIAAAALAGSQAGIILPPADRARLVLPADDPALQLLRGATNVQEERNLSEHPLFCDSALCAPGLGARAALAAPIRLPGGPVFGALIAAGQCEITPTARQREELARIAERTAEEVLARYAARTDPATGALSAPGLVAALRRESRRAALHGRPACLAVIALHRAPGAPRRMEGEVITEELRAAVLEDMRLADAAALSAPMLHAAVERARTALRATDRLALAPPPPPGISMDMALDMPVIAPEGGPSCIAVLMAETDCEQGHGCIRRLAAKLIGADLPGAPGSRIAAVAGLAPVAPDVEGGTEAAEATLAAAYTALAAGKAGQRVVGRLAA